MDTAAYSLRELDLGEDGRVLAGIHFHGVEARRPFVGVLARTRALDDRPRLVRIGRRLQQAFAGFAPERWRVCAWPHDLALAQTPGAPLDVSVLAGRVAR